MYGEENIISAVIHVDETTPHLHCDFVPQAGLLESIGERRKEKCAGRKRNFLAMQESSLAPNSARWSRKHITA